MINPPSLAFGGSLRLSCMSRGSPPDTFIFIKDGTPITPPASVDTVSHSKEEAVFKIDYTINISDSGTYTCTVTNPIGNDSEAFTISAYGKSAS